MTETQWADLLLEDIPAPITAANERNVEVWMANEEPSAQWWGGFGSAGAPGRINPLNASVGSGAGGGISSGGLGTYPDLTTAAAYTAGMINQQNMAPIRQALEASAAPSSFGAAVISSPWAESHYGGNVGRFTGGVTPGPAVTNPAAIGTATGGAPPTAGFTGTTGTGTGTDASLTGIPLIGGVTDDIKKGGAYLLLLATGLSLMALGAYKTASPGMQAKIRSTAGLAAKAPLAAAAL